MGRQPDAWPGRPAAGRATASAGEEAAQPAHRSPATPRWGLADRRPPKLRPVPSTCSGRTRPAPSVAKSPSPSHQRARSQRRALPLLGRQVLHRPHRGRRGGAVLEVRAPRLHGALGCRPATLRLPVPRLGLRLRRLPRFRPGSSRARCHPGDRQWRRQPHGRHQPEHADHSGRVRTGQTRSRTRRTIVRRQDSAPGDVVRARSRRGWELFKSSQR